MSARTSLPKSLVSRLELPEYCVKNCGEVGQTGSRPNETYMTA
jgi:hypothetical protein